MLIISRRIGEVLRINEDVKIMVLDVDKYRVKLGIQAPKQVAVDREEIYVQRLQAGAGVPAPAAQSNPQ